MASYSNGDTKNIGQIAVASFTNPEGLEKVGDNLYAATLNSGAFDGIGEDISESSGKIYIRSILRCLMWILHIRIYKHDYNSERLSG